MPPTSRPRVLLSAPLAAALLLATPGPGRAADPAPTPPADRAGGYGGVLNILPPGSAGNVTGADLVRLGIDKGSADPVSFLQGLAAPQALLTTATADSPPQVADQLERYDALNTVAPGALTDARLGDFYKDASLQVPDAAIVRTETPRPGVTIRWDADGVPHVQGVTDADVAYGAGVANTETRMFLTDVLRHTGAARMSEFVGPTPANIAMDAEQLRIAAYTPAQLDRQITRLAARSERARRLVASLDAYIAGINDTQARLCPASTASVPLPGALGLGFGADCPVEYAALQRPPQPYTRGDIVSIASLVGGIFGAGGGHQDENARWLQRLEQRFGRVVGRRMYDDLREKDDPEAPVTSTRSTPYGGSDRVRPDLPGVALPDLRPKAEQLATGALVGSDGSLSDPAAGSGGAATPGLPSAPGLPVAAAVETRRREMLARYGVDPIATAEGVQGTVQRALAGEDVGMSNALLIAGRHAAGGRPAVVFGPQTGYYAPQLLVEMELSGPHQQARGVSFAGTSFVIELGRGVDYAWSATSAGSDITDTVVQRLCNRDGSKPTVDSVAFLDERGRCRPMARYLHRQTGLPSLAAQAAPTQLTFLVLRTDQGLVQRRTTVKGRPVAIVTKRSTYEHEVDSVLGFAALNDPAQVRDAAGFQRAAAQIQYTFNWFYADDRDIAYYSSARLPRRSPEVDLDLPRWADKRFDWRGFVSFADHPRDVNPARGYLVSWNNKPARDFAAASQSWGYGSVYRSRTLEDRARALIRAGRPVDRSDLVGAMIDAATVDVRAAYVLPRVLRVLGTPSDPEDAAAVRALRAWVADGAHRVDRDRTGGYDHQPAIALLDTWWDPAAAGASCASACGFSLPLDALRPTLGPLVGQLPQQLDDHPRLHIGSAFNGIAWYGYLDKDLRTLLGDRVQGRWSRTYCGTTLARCRATLLASLHRAVESALATQGVTAVDAFTYDKSQDDIVSVAGGVVGVRRIDWQNRPTFQQVVRFDAHRPRG
ncbi:penicillin acylase family protein [Nocardioides sp. TRM66260-LWL]|uniref:penicillin acylase family protein n=1 Tax=Nocardioides sp. TRM66260-LWL TaxID=2874478 RepID=UPI001CC72B68|nr:penicillin acylase family protein [Nocardioides sp. TRM66260-LWL]MBZ5733018.1 penicillin acylase family protein [Nocardioides sp. TRM66260-LWL]